MNSTNWYNFKFVNGPISSQEIGETIKQGSLFVNAGAYDIFLGQVREDIINGKNVNAIDYTANNEMATEAFSKIASDAKEKYDIKSIKIIHSLGQVKKGELCLMVLVMCGHRKESFIACEYIVERLKKEVPVWGKEILEDKTHSWKINK